MRRGRKWYALLGLVGWLVVGFLGVRPASALYLNDDQTMIFTATFYNQWRIRLNDARGANTSAAAGSTFQHRYFIDPQIRVTVTPWFDRFPGGEHIPAPLLHRPADPGYRDAVVRPFPRRRAHSGSAQYQ
jgi:hypothetical protein